MQLTNPKLRVAPLPLGGIWGRPSPQCDFPPPHFWGSRNDGRIGGDAAHSDLKTKVLRCSDERVASIANYGCALLVGKAIRTPTWAGRDPSWS